MNEIRASDQNALAQLRADFDRTFAAAPHSRRQGESLMRIQVAGEAFAVHVGHIAGLAKAGKIVPLPSRIPELLGLTAQRGVLLPVYDLAALLGLAPRATAPTWLLLVARGAPIALAFDSFEGQAVPEWISDEPSAAHAHARQLARMGSAVRAVLDIPGIADAIAGKAGLMEPAHEGEPQETKPQERKQ